MHVISATAGQASAGTTEDSETGDSFGGSFARTRTQRVGRTVIEYYLKPRPCESCKMVKFQVRLVPRHESAPSRTQFVHEKYLNQPEPLEPDDDDEDDVVIDMQSENMFDASKAVLKARQETQANDVLIEFKERGKPDVCASLSYLPPVFLVMWARSVLVADPETGRVRQISEVPVVTALSHKNIILDDGPVPLANVYVLTRSVLQVDHQYVDLKMALLLDTGEKSFTMSEGSGPSSLRLSMRASNMLESESNWTGRSAFSSTNDSFIGHNDAEDQSEEADIDHLDHFLAVQRQRRVPSRAPQVLPQSQAAPSTQKGQGSFLGRVLSSVMPGSQAKAKPLKKEEMVLAFFDEEEEGRGAAPPPALDTTPLHTASSVNYGGGSGAAMMNCSGNGYVPSNDSSSEAEKGRMPSRDQRSPRTRQENRDEEEEPPEEGLVERVMLKDESLASASSSEDEDEEAEDEDDDDNDHDEDDHDDEDD